MYPSAGPSRKPPSPHAHGLLLSFDRDEPVEFDVEMPPPAGREPQHSSGPYYTPHSSRSHSHHAPEQPFTRLPALDTSNLGLRTFSDSREFGSPHSPLLPFPSPAFNAQYLDSRPPPSSTEYQNAAAPALSATPSTHDLYESFKAPNVTSRMGAKQSWELQCPRCETWVPTSLSAVRFLDRPGHFINLEAHMRGARCKSAIAPSPISRAAAFSAGTSYAHSPAAFSPSSSSGSIHPWSPHPSPAFSPPNSGSPHTNASPIDPNDPWRVYSIRTLDL
ncbi:hypothetical protein DFH09DRAFT_1434251 [Mycena vulgaris]|nr:hypothetical protein DFH09DRAFT_1434251 [Mycena vulgaris]